MNNISFKGYIPVEIYAKNNGDKTYHRVLDKPDGYLRKCQGAVVRNLNKTLKQPDEKFIEFYKSHDKDYALKPVVKSLYDKEFSSIYMVTGLDADMLGYYGKCRGTADNITDKYYQKSDFRNVYYKKKAVHDYFSNSFNYLNNNAKRVKSPQGDDLKLKVYFEAKRNKNDEITGFKLTNAKFEKE